VLPLPLLLLLLLLLPLLLPISSPPLFTGACLDEDKGVILRERGPVRARTLAKAAGAYLSCPAVLAV